MAFDFYRETPYIDGVHLIRQALLGLCDQGVFILFKDPTSYLITFYDKREVI